MLTRRAMLTSTPALALAVATPAVAERGRQIGGHVSDHVERLAQELADALVGYGDGNAMFRVYPAGTFPQGDFFPSYMARGAKDHRLSMAMAELKRAAMACDPTATGWIALSALDDNQHERFHLVGRKANKA